MNFTWCRALAPAAVVFAALLPAHAQQQQPLQPPPPQAQQNPFCSRLEAQLQSFDRGSNDAARAEQVRKFEEAAANQQAEIDRQEMAAQRAGCEKNNFLALFSGNQAQCGPLTRKIQQMRDNLERIQVDMERLRGDPGPEREGQRRAIVVALAQNNCGAQYQQQAAAAQPPRSGGIDGIAVRAEVGLRTGRRSSANRLRPRRRAAPSAPSACAPATASFIRFPPPPIRARFAEDEKACRQSCPAADVQLYSHRNPGEDINQAVSVGSQQPYTALPNAFRYRTSLDQSCSCRRPGESWSQALKNIEDPTVEQGDIVVNDQRARQLSQPRVDAQGKPIKQAPVAPAKPDPKAASRPRRSPRLRPRRRLPRPSAAPADDGPSKPDPEPHRARGRTGVHSVDALSETFRNRRLRFCSKRRA